MKNVIMDYRMVQELVVIIVVSGHDVHQKMLRSGMFISLDIIFILLMTLLLSDLVETVILLKLILELRSRVVLQRIVNR